MVNRLKRNLKMEINSEKIFEEISEKLILILPKEGFQEARLEIKRLPMNVGFTGHYLDKDGSKHWLDIFNFSLDGKYIHKLHEITTNQDPKHVEWNRANFTLLNDLKFNIKYSYDKSLEVNN